jgi:hypothetical protein
MMIIGCDFHPRFQQIAGLDTETGESVEQRLLHTAEAESFIGLWRAGRCAWVWKRQEALAGSGAFWTSWGSNWYWGTLVGTCSSGQSPSRDLTETKTGQELTF